MLKNNVSSYMNEEKRDIIRNSEYTFRDALEVSAFLIETGKFPKIYKEMQIANLQKEIADMD